MGEEIFEELVARDCPKRIKVTKPQIQESYKVLVETRMNPEKTTLRQITLKPLI